MRRGVAMAVLVLLAVGCRGDGEDVAAPSTTAGPAVTTTTPPEPTTAASPPSSGSSSATGSTAAQSGSTPAAPPAPGGPPCDVPGGYPEPWPERPRYSARLNVEPGKRLVTGDVAVRFTPEADTDRLVFRLWPNAPRIGRAGGRLDVTSATITTRPPPPGERGVSGVAGQPVPGRYEAGGAVAGKPGTIWIMPGSFPAGRPVEARLEFRLTVPGALNDRVAAAGRALRLGSVIPVLSWIRGDGWHTSPATALNAEAAASEVADWDVTVTAPAGYTTLAAGDETRPGPGGEAAGAGGASTAGGPPAAAGPSSSRFVARAVRDWAATVAPMRLGRVTAQGGRTEIVVGVAEGAAGDPTALAARHAQALNDLAARFGEYPYARLTIGVTTGLTGGIEFPTHIFLGSAVDPLHLVHEVAHQWFYALVGNDQYRDPWLDEGLAMYGQARVDGQLPYQRSRAIPAAGRGRLGESMPYWGRNGGAYYVSVYVGGLQAVSKYGDALGGYGPLDCAIRRYVRDRAYSVARPSDILASFAAQSGVDPAPILGPLGVR